MKLRSDNAIAALLMALLPGTLVQTAVYGWGTLAKLSLCMLACLGIEVLLRRPWSLAQLRSTAGDGSTLLTGLLLGLALPAQGPWWLPLLGAAFAIAIGKQLFAAHGASPFNPAMVGLALLFLCVPQAMTRWLPEIDSVSSATLLDHVRTELHLARTIEEIFANRSLMRSREVWINLAFLAGGLWLLWRKHLPWQIPAGVLAGLALPALLLWAGDISRHPSPLFHLLSGSTMLAAFFIATAPPSSPRAGSARLVYGLGIGVLIYAVRSIGAYPDGIAFAVLLLNAAAPALDRWTLSTSAPWPRTWPLAAVALLLATLSMVGAGYLQQRRANAVPELAALGFDGATAGGAVAVHDAQFGDFRLYRIQRQGEPAGLMLRTLTPGYAGEVDVLTALHTDGRIAAVRVLHHLETRGIGDRIEAAHDPWVLGYTGKTPDTLDIDQLSGATVSAHAVSTAVQRSLEYYAVHRDSLPAP